MSGYVFRETAAKELQEILNFIADQDGVERALVVHDAFLEVFETIAAIPHAGSRRPHLTGATIRWRSVLCFLVIYDPEAQPVLILSVIHGARDIDRHFGSEPET